MNKTINVFGEIDCQTTKRQGNRNKQQKRKKKKAGHYTSVTKKKSSFTACGLYPSSLLKRKEESSQWPQNNKNNPPAETSISVVSGSAWETQRKTQRERKGQTFERKKKKYVPRESNQTILITFLPNLITRTDNQEILTPIRVSLISLQIKWRRRRNREEWLLAS